MGSNTSQPLAELSEEDIEFISTKAKIDHESVKIWYEKLKVGSIVFSLLNLTFVFTLGCLPKWKNF